MGTMSTTCVALSGGVAPVAGVGKKYRIEVTTDGSPWAVGDEWTFDFIHSLTGLIEQVGFGPATGQGGAYCMTFNDKVYVLAGSTALFSAVDEATVFNDPNGAGNGQVDMSNFFRSPEALQAVVVYQGRLAFFSRYTIQIWNVNADPAQWQQQQVLQNVGTIAPLSVHALGELDVFFLANSGIRSLRSRETSLNAFVADIGSPLDSIIQAVLETASDNEKSSACGVVEPESNRYWLFLKDTIYVLSYFPSNKIIAWSTYKATYDNAGVQTAFVPLKFVVFNGQVYARASDALYQYGGANKTTYDGCVATVETPWLDLKTPGTRKAIEAFDVAITNAWKLEAGADPVSGSVKQVFTGTMPSFDAGRIPAAMQGTHVKMRASTTGTTSAKFSSFLIKYQEADVR